MLSLWYFIILRCWCFFFFCSITTLSRNWAGWVFLLLRALIMLIVCFWLSLVSWLGGSSITILAFFSYLSLLFIMPILIFYDLIIFFISLYFIVSYCFVIVLFFIGLASFICVIFMFLVIRCFAIMIMPFHWLLWWFWLVSGFFFILNLCIFCRFMLNASCFTLVILFIDNFINIFIFPWLISHVTN